MLVTIGIQNIAREVRVETDESEEIINAAVERAVTNGEPLIITSNKGAKTYVPAAALAYVEVGPIEKRSVGFAHL